jgi:hypothetical protein
MVFTIPPTAPGCEYRWFSDCCRFDLPKHIATNASLFDGVAINGVFGSFGMFCQVHCLFIVLNVFCNIPSAIFTANVYETAYHPIGPYQQHRIACSHHPIPAAYQFWFRAITISLDGFRVAIDPRPLTDVWADRENFDTVYFFRVFIICSIFLHQHNYLDSPFPTLGQVMAAGPVLIEKGLIVFSESLLNQSLFQCDIPLPEDHTVRDSFGCVEVVWGREGAGAGWRT